jgi:transglutaminase-like putative cysteine protease
MRAHRVSVALVTFCLIFPNLLRGQTTSARQAESNRVSFTLQFRITGKPGTEKVVLTALMPKTLEGRQKILSTKYSLRPEKEFEENGNKYARFVVNNPVGLQVINAEVEAELYRYDLSIAPNRRHAAESKERLAPWLKAEKFIEVDAKEIKQAAKSITGADEFDTIRNIMLFVHQKVRYSGFDETDHGAMWAMQNGKGDCTEFTDLFVALCRAKNIPARVWDGYTIDEVKKGDTPKHVRAEVYTRRYGWVPFDPLHVARKSAAFDALKPIFIYFDNQRNDATIENFHFSSYRYFGKPIDYDSGILVTAVREMKR